MRFLVGGANQPERRILVLAHCGVFVRGGSRASSQWPHDSRGTFSAGRISNLEKRNQIVRGCSSSLGRRDRRVDMVSSYRFRIVFLQSVFLCVPTVQRQSRNLLEPSLPMESHGVKWYVNSISKK